MCRSNCQCGVRRRGIDLAVGILMKSNLAIGGFVLAADDLTVAYDELDTPCVLPASHTR